MIRSFRNRHLPQPIAFVALSLVLFAFFFAASAPSPAFVALQHQWSFSASLLTIAFGVYAIALLFSLIVFGALSDHVGRRPVIVVALIIQAISMVMFFRATDIVGLIVARAVQGFATGIATGALAAAVVEAAPENQKRLGAMISSVSPLAGLATGALISGIALKETLHPITLVFGVLALIFVIGAMLLIFIPESMTKRAGAWNSMIPKVSVPANARLEFWRGVPVLIATWALGGLYLALAPFIIQHIFQVDNGIINGLSIATLAGVGAIAPSLLKRFALPKAAMIGMACILVGLLLIVFSISTLTLPLFFIATAISGIGFGGAFSAIVQRLAPIVDRHQRAELFAAIFVVSYLALSVPAMLAGFLVRPLGLSLTVMLYLRLLFAMAGIGMLLQWLSLKDLEEADSV